MFCTGENMLDDILWCYGLYLCLGAAAGALCSYITARMDTAVRRDYLTEYGTVPPTVADSKVQKLFIYAALAGIFLLTGLYSFPVMKTVFVWLLALLLAVQCVIDCRYQLLPDTVTALIAVLGLIYNGLLLLQAVQEALLGGMAGVAVMLLIYLLSRGGMGFGDVKLAAALGLCLGLDNIFVCLLLAFVTGGIVAAVLLAIRAKDRQEAVPFGPFLCLGAQLSIFCGQQLLSWYLQQF